jgi:hypothetical protein
VFEAHKKGFEEGKKNIKKKYKNDLKAAQEQLKAKEKELKALRKAAGQTSQGNANPELAGISIDELRKAMSDVYTTILNAFVEANGELKKKEDKAANAANSIGDLKAQANIVKKLIKGQSQATELTDEYKALPQQFKNVAVGYSAQKKLSDAYQKKYCKEGVQGILKKPIKHLTKKIIANANQKKKEKKK